MMHHSGAHDAIVELMRSTLCIVVDLGALHNKLFSPLLPLSSFVSPPFPSLPLLCLCSSSLLLHLPPSLPSPISFLLFPIFLNSLCLSHSQTVDSWQCQRYVCWRSAGSNTTNRIQP